MQGKSKLPNINDPAIISWLNKLNAEGRVKGFEDITAPEKKAKQPKYRNKKVEWKGEVFDSIKELERYLELLGLERQGFISDLKKQVPYIVIPKQKCKRECTYIADFTYIDVNEVFQVEDVKPYDKKNGKYILNPRAKVLLKLMQSVYNINVKLV